MGTFAGQIHLEFKYQIHVFENVPESREFSTNGLCHISPLLTGPQDRLSQNTECAPFLSLSSLAPSLSSSPKTLNVLPLSLFSCSLSLFLSKNTQCAPSLSLLLLPLSLPPSLPLSLGQRAEKSLLNTKICQINHS